MSHSFAGTGTRGNGTCSLGKGGGSRQSIDIVQQPFGAAWPFGRGLVVPDHRAGADCQGSDVQQTTMNWYSRVAKEIPKTIKKDVKKILTFECGILIMEPSPPSGTCRRQRGRWCLENLLWPRLSSSGCAVSIFATDERRCTQMENTEKEKGLRRRRGTAKEKWGDPGAAVSSSSLLACLGTGYQAVKRTPKLPQMNPTPTPDQPHNDSESISKMTRLSPFLRER